jgi:hypothetical protein
MFDGYPLVVLAPPFGAAAFCAAHLLACRLAPQRGQYFRIVAGFFAGLPVAGIVSFAGLISMEACAADRAALLALNLLTYLGLAFGYFAFVNLNIASLRIRMLQELLEAGRSMPKEQLLARYNTHKVIALRIQRLVQGGHLVQQQGRFYIGKRHFLAVGRIFDAVRRIILGAGTVRRAGREP